MMKPLLTIFCQFIAGVTLISCTVEAAQTSSSIDWLTNYEEAINLSKATSRPVVLFFTGSDWCSWCTKLEKESLETPEFVQATRDKFIFMKLDFPLNSALPPHIAAQNKQLQKKYNVRGFPTLIVLDGKQQMPIGSSGYLSGGGKVYADHLSKVITHYSQYQDKMQAMNQQLYSSAELKKLYEAAQTFGYNNDVHSIIKAGMTSDDRHFFMMERYRLIAHEGLLNTAEADTLKQQLQLLDPQNEKMTHYHIALVDFEASHDPSEQQSNDAAVESLLNYIDRFGSKDKEHLWRLQMIISQVYFDKNNLPEALRFAKGSYASAPPSAKMEISMAIKNIQSQLSTNTIMVQ